MKDDWCTDDWFVSLGPHENFNLVLFDIGRRYHFYHSVTLGAAAVEFLYISLW